MMTFRVVRIFLMYILKYTFTLRYLSLTSSTVCLAKCHSLVYNNYNKWNEAQFIKFIRFIVQCWHFIWYPVSFLTFKHSRTFYRTQNENIIQQLQSTVNQINSHWFLLSCSSINDVSMHNIIYHIVSNHTTTVLYMNVKCTDGYYFLKYPNMQVHITAIRSNSSQ